MAHSHGSVEIISRGVEGDRMTTRSLLRLLLCAGQLGVAMGFYGGVYTAAHYFCDKWEERRLPLKLALAASCTASAMSAVVSVHAYA
eukprot:5675723-Pleurochrysis_carterae.AAC.1